MFKRKKKSLAEYSTGELILFRFRKNKLAKLGVFLLVFVSVAVLLAPVLSSYAAVTKMHISDRFTPPNAIYIFGTDEFGRDLFARVLYGGRISLLCSFAIIITQAKTIHCGRTAGCSAFGIPLKSSLYALFCSFPGFIA